MHTKSFLENWQDRLRRPSTLWEGPRAIAELKRLGYLDHVRGEEHWQSKDLLGLIVAEVQLYQSAVGKELSAREFRLALEVLQAVNKKLNRAAKRIHTRDVKNFLENVIRRMEKNRKNLLRCKEQWAKRSESPFGMREILWLNQPRKQILVKRIDLDGRLQSQLAKYLKTSMPDLSLQTVARLVVLAYWAANLARETDGKGYLECGDPPRRLSVRSVNEKLTYQGFNRKSRNLARGLR